MSCIFRSCNFRSYIFSAPTPKNRPRYDL